ncbi:MULTISPECIES: glycosyltransferase family 4 protein [Staphylococcus]|uniref:CapK protein n=1 Tax=Staphylococcus haemolyticus (strain JCSC1435) TaxID=279808 RepID=Q4L9G8_STAHJ|nr:MULTISPECIES: glycosyltransferase family 4 protein [Staphylococcus]AYX84279.1 glycosyltransferase WbuB [Staphylococcus haemolyticus]MBW3857467.1 glycosyltransferase family 4 protein [Staphylococcus haemolyticus]MBW5902809.1 glycosyltransferase family 4 protein [Staphylococcus haemolyticus]MCH4417166.1 glycosyltransferase family 4 protein [Staphylococcus haemolyticus]MCH4504050.1 glycosyltransferase family 4 protein [Staphylococcus haemolyticus]
MNALFLTVGNFRSIHNQGIYQDFIKELSTKCEYVLVVSPVQRREKKSTYIIREGNVVILRVKIPNITKTNKIEKGISTLLIEKLYAKAINKYFNDVKFDTIIYSTPPITFSGLIKKLKKTNHSQTYLMLKDIFPQNAVDLKMFRANGLFDRYFRNKEKNTYKISDFIGVMSPANKNYLLSHNSYISENKVHLFRNSTYDSSKEINENERISILKKYNLSSNKTTFIYGGNIGVPQGTDAIKEVIKRFNEMENSQLVIVGSGTKFKEIQNYAQNIKDVFVLNQLPKKDYDLLLSVSDIGLVFLDSRFTIPNYPSRLTSYLMLSKPVISMTDENTDIGMEIEKYDCGFSIVNENIDKFILDSNKLANDIDLRKQMSINAKKMFNDLFRIEENVREMLNFITKKEREE